MREVDAAPPAGQVSPPRRSGCLRLFLLAYLVLLVASHLVQWLVPLKEAEEAFARETAAGSTLRMVTLPELDSRLEKTGRDIHLAYREWGDAAQPTILLFQGSPGSGRDFDRIAPGLVARGYHALAIDLPGFGASSQDLADYSFRTHAAYCRELLDLLGLEQVDLLAYSMGGGVAIHLADAEPQRVRSVVLLSTIGVQELELLGIYQLNHAIHGAQLLSFELADHLIPHFGVVQLEGLNHAYARNFYDSDQRPLRGMLSRYDRPMLILHGRQDMLVPYEAALEHHRLVPQSELLSFDTNHFMPYTQPELVIEPIADFLDEVGRGEAKSRAEAAPERIAAAESHERIHRPQASGPTLLVWMLLLALATLISEDLTCIAAGLLVAQGAIGFVPAVIACGAGIFLGDLGLYGLGRLGRPLIERGWLRWLVKDKDLERSRRFLDRRGAQLIFASRFMPGTRLPMYVSAGLLAMPFWRFALLLFLPVAAWTPLLVGVSVAVGEPFFEFFGRYERSALPFFGAAVVLILLLTRLLRSLLTWRGRRLLYGALQRKLRWEFWPPWMFYPPVFLYIVWLAVRKRSPTLFTAANPGMSGGGGFVGESKSEILAELAEADVAQYRVLPSGRVEARLEAVESFQQEIGASYPIVLKPNVGQRGSGVVVARSRQEVVAFLENTPGLAIVQQYIAGPELGVFYVRMPDAERGTIFSITDKQLTAVVGNGALTLEQLILKDARAVFLAPKHLAHFEDRLEEVPAAGERVQLTDLGTHCLGATFHDGQRFWTPELEAEVDRIAKAYVGFYFGRFDFRAPSFEHFRRGEALQVLELNGVTSEATSIYDPQKGVLAAWKKLFEQWRLAYEIGEQNRRRGHEPAGLRELLRLSLEFRRKLRQDAARLERK